MSMKNWENNIACLIPTWLCAGLTLGAYKNFRKYYPNIPIFIVDDEYSEDAVNKFYRTYQGKHSKIFDPDSTKLMGLPNSAYIRVPHEGFETEGHGNAITKAMPLIRHKWIVHLSSDVRILEEGVLEYMFEGMNNKYCGAGEQHDSRVEGWPNVAKELCIYRGDLYHKYNLNFFGGGELGGHIDCGTLMYRDLVEKGYKLKYCDPMRYAIHIRPDSEGWDKYYEIHD